MLGLGTFTYNITICLAKIIDMNISREYLQGRSLIYNKSMTFSNSGSIPKANNS